MDRINEKDKEHTNAESEIITPRYLLNLIKPILSDKLVAKFRFEREGLRITFCNGQKFLLKIEEI